MASTRSAKFWICHPILWPSQWWPRIALMRLEQLFPGAAQSLIRNYVPECATDHRWDGVTFAQCPRHGDRIVSYRRSIRRMRTLLALADSFSPSITRIRSATRCQEYERRSPPGTEWVYHTSDTYVLGVALQQFLRQRYGPTADFYRDLLVEPLVETARFEPTGGGDPSHLRRGGPTLHGLRADAAQR